MCAALRGRGGRHHGVMHTTSPPVQSLPSVRSARPPADLLVIGWSPRGAASLSSAAGRLLVERSPVPAMFVDTADLPMVPAGLDDDAYPVQIRDLLAEAASATALVLTGPVIRSSLSGQFRNGCELLRGALAGTPTALVAAAGSSRAQLAVEAAVADLFLNFGADVVRKPVVVTEGLDAEELLDRLDDLTRALLAKVEVAR